jgi:hypothetical protein
MTGTIARLHIMLFGIVYGGLSLAPSLIFTKSIGRRTWRALPSRRNLSGRKVG